MENENLGSILIVDDNEQNLQVLAGVLSSNGYDFAMEMDGASAIEFAKEMKPDLILLDVMMPGMDGYEVCQILKQDNTTKDIPVIFLTAKTGIEDLVKGFKIGAVDYINKPFKKEELLARVSTHLELVRIKKSLILSNETKDLLFSIIAHDLRGNVGIIYSWLKIFLDKNYSFQENEMQETLGELFGHAETTYTLLENLLDWSRNQRDKITLEPYILSLKPVVDEVCKIIDELAKRKSIIIKNQIPGEVLAYFDQKTISTVFRNLISNSIKFTPEGGEIKISVKKDLDLLKIAISDNGIGMDENKAKQLFHIKKMQSTEGTKGEGGTGLGLMLCKDFIEINGGTIWVESEINKGSTFYFTLPLSEGH